MFGTNLKTLRLNHHYSIETLAKKLNEHYHTRISKSMISRWEQGQVSPQISYVRLIADYFSVTFDELIYSKNINQPIEAATAMEATYHLPILQTIDENNVALAKANANDFESVLAEDLAEGKFFYTKMLDDAMLPNIPVNAMLLVKETASVIDDEVVVILNTKNHQLYVRRFYQDGNNIILTADNHAHQPILLNSTWSGKVIGRVIRVTTSL